MKVQLECTYCGHKWIETIYNRSATETMTCKHGNCRDSNLIVRDLTTTKVDYYAGSPPFPEKAKDNGYPFFGGGYHNPHEGNY